MVKLNGADEVNGEGNGEAFVDVDGGDVGETSGEELDKEVGGAGGADSDGGAGETLEAEPPAADEGAGVAARFRVKPPEYLDD